MVYALVKRFLFLLSAERAHHFSTTILNGLCKLPPLRYLIEAIFRFEDERLHTSLWGLNFKNPVGLAAGFDKDGTYISSMTTLGFGFIEVGTVTPRPQAGNPKPRLFRLPQDQGIINRMGFNNGGVDLLVERLKKLKKQEVIIGGNIGKNKDTPNDLAYEDYSICFQKLYPYVDYFVVNLSSPNTPGLRSLQEKGPLKKILTTLTRYRDTQKMRRPILLKISPDLNEDQIKDVLEIIEEVQIEGIIATNTTISRSNLSTDDIIVNEIGNGGLSGRPLTGRSTEVIEMISSTIKNEIPIIGVGGIYDEKTAQQKMQSGASLIQIYSGLIYEGPGLVKRIKKALCV